MDQNRSDTYIHGHHDSVLRSHRWRTAENSCGYLLPHLTPGMRILDVGCGPGTVTRDLARLVAPGEVIGIDPSAKVIDEARDLDAPRVTFQTGDVYDLDFPDDSFDVVHAHQVLQHLTRPVDALVQMRRVMKPSGRLAVRDSAYRTFRWHPANPALEDWLDLYVAVTKKNHVEADAGLFLREWVRAAGFRDLEVSSSTWTFADPKTCRWWGDSWADRATQSTFAEQALAHGLADQARLERIAAGWKAWADHPDAILIILLVEVMARP